MSYEDVTPGDLAQSGNIFCEGCRELRAFGLEFINTLPSAGEPDPIVIIARFAGFSALCNRKTPVPAAECKPGACSTIDNDRDCQFVELLNMTPAERLQKAKELSNIVEFSTD